MTENELNSLIELLVEDIGWFFIWFIGNLPFIIPFLIGLYFIQKKFSRRKKKKSNTTKNEAP